MTSLRRPRVRPAGFTLLELVIGLTASAIIIAGGVALLIGQQRRFQTGSAERQMQDTARTALQELTGTLRLAGFGVDPGLALDLGRSENITMYGAVPTAGATVVQTGWACTGGNVLCRDRIDAPDELVFYTRDPSFGHRITSVGGTGSITIAGPLSTPLYRGQVLLLICSTSTTADNIPYWAYVTVGSYVGPSAAATVSVSLLSATGGALDFPSQNASLSQACFGLGDAVATKVDRYRYYVRAFDAAGIAQNYPELPERPSTTPFLMLDQGLLDQDGTPLLTAVAPDVEDLQVAYSYPGSGVLVGATPSTRITADAAGIDLAPASGVPGYGTGYDAASRTNRHPANVRAVQLTLVVRQASTDIGIADATVPAAGNRPDAAGLAGFRRLRIQTTVVLPNLEARLPYYPSYTAVAGDQLNVGGG
jgi:type IV pilus assembly protein PilW